MRYCFDLDGTICDTPIGPDGKVDYVKSTPIPFMVDTVNRLKDEGHYIIIMTARGRNSGIDWGEWTEQCLEKWGVRYDWLEPMFHKPNADIFIDDKGVNVTDWVNTQPTKKGIIAGAFDIIHPGYVRMFDHAKKYCNHLTVALHVDPTTERSWKMSPVNSVEDRTEVLLSLKNVDEVVTYNTEDQFLNLLRGGEYDCRFLGDDYDDGNYSGAEIRIPIIWVPRRDHGFSTTKLKQRIFQSIYNG